MADIYTLLTQSQQIANAVLAKVKAKGYAVEADLGTLAKKSEVTKAELGAELKAEIEGKADKTDIAEYTLTKQATAESGYSATYQLFKGETAVGDKVNIPKDMVVESGDVKTVEKKGEPYDDAEVGDKYIDLVIANKAESHIYIPVTDLIDVYTGGNGIEVTGQSIAVKVDSANANGLSTSASGVALALASGTGAGAMSAADKTKLDNADVTAYTNGNGISITEHAIAAVVDGNNGLSVGASGIALALASTTASGAMSSTDKAKLDDIRPATSTEVDAVIAALDTL